MFTHVHVPQPQLRAAPSVLSGYVRGKGSSFPRPRPLHRPLIGGGRGKEEPFPLRQATIDRQCRLRVSGSGDKVRCRSGEGFMRVTRRAKAFNALDHRAKRVEPTHERSILVFPTPPRFPHGVVGPALGVRVPIHMRKEGLSFPATHRLERSTMTSLGRTPTLARLSAYRADPARRFCMPSGAKPRHARSRVPRYTGAMVRKPCSSHAK